MKVSERRARAEQDELSSEWTALATDSSLQVRKAIAGRADAPPTALIVLASDNVRTVREAVVENPNCPDDALRLLVADPDPYVCREAVQHPNATSQTRHAVAVTGGERARRALAQMSDLDTATSVHLMNDDDWQVRYALAQMTQHREVLAGLLRDPHPRVRGSVAANPLASAEQRRILARDATSETRALVASARDNPDDVYFALARDKSEHVRFCLTVHGTNRPLMRLLMQDPSQMVASTAANSLRRPPRSDVVVHH